MSKKFVSEKNFSKFFFWVENRSNSMSCSVSGTKFVRFVRFGHKLKVRNYRIQKSSSIIFCEILNTKSLKGIIWRFIRIFKTPSGTRMILGILRTSLEDQRPPMAKRMDTSTLFSCPHVNQRLQSWDPSKNIYKSCFRRVTTSNWWNSELKSSVGKSDYDYTWE